MGLILINGYGDNHALTQELQDPRSILNKFVKFYAEKNYTVKAIDDSDDIGSADLILFTEMPVEQWSNYRYFLDAYKKKCTDRMIVWMLESPTHFPFVWKNKKLHECFRYILTWNNFLIDNQKYHKIFYGQTWRFSEDFHRSFNTRKLITLIAANKVIRHPYELFSERREAIRAFERLCPYDFDLYGAYWNEPTTGIWWDQHIAERQYPFLVPQFPSSHGMCREKIATLTHYKFYLCYENMISSSEFSGYITEKIFDAFFAGCVPVYLGDMNIEKVIPNNLYIERSKFKNYEELYVYLANMPEQIWNEYQKRIYEYLHSELFVNTFSEHRFLQTIIQLADKIL